MVKGKTCRVQDCHPEDRLLKQRPHIRLSPGGRCSPPPWSGSWNACHKLMNELHSSEKLTYTHAAGPMCTSLPGTEPIPIVFTVMFDLRTGTLVLVGRFSPSSPCDNPFLSGKDGIGLLSATNWLAYVTKALLKPVSAPIDGAQSLLSLSRWTAYQQDCQ